MQIQNLFFLLFRFRAEDLHLGEDAEPEAVMESLDMVDQMLAGGTISHVNSIPK
jgi:hypothetical protein